MTAAEKTDVDHFELDRLRNLITARLAEKGGAFNPSSLVDLMTKPKAEGQALKRPCGRYLGVVTRGNKTTEAMKIKPAHGQWTTTTHATATRPAGFSRALGDFHEGGDAYSAEAVWRLHPVHVASIMARYSDNPKQRDASRNALAKYLSDRFRAEKVKDRALIMARKLLDGKTAGDVRRALEMTQKQWRDSRPVRNTYYMVTQALETLDAGALYAWQEECFKGFRY